MNSRKADGRPPRTWLRPALLTGVGLVAIGLGVAYWQRAPIATRLIDRVLASRGVQASYRIARLDPGGATLAALVIGDPAAPDLVASEVDVRIGWGFGSARIAGIALDDVVLRGRLDDKGLRLGALDRLRPAPTGEPFALPDLNVRLRGARMILATKGGTVGVAAEGDGNLADGFEGRVAVSAPAIEAGGCRLSRARALLDVETANRVITASGQSRLTGAECSGVRSGPAAALISASVPEALDSASGRIDASARGLVYAAGGTAALIGLNGGFNLAAAGSAAGFNGAARWEGLTAPQSLGAKISRIAAGLVHTPLGPVGDRAAKAVVRALGRSDGSAQVALAMKNGAGRLSIANLGARAASGAQLTTNGRILRLGWPGGAVQSDGGIVLSGGGMPEVRADIQPRGKDGWQLLGSMMPYAATGGRLALSPIQLDWQGGRGRIVTQATLDGPLPGGSVKGLLLPIDVSFGKDGSLGIGGGNCADIRFVRLDISGARFGETRLPLCAAQGATLFSMTGDGRLKADIRAPQLRLNGSMGDAPLGLAVDGLRLSVSGTTAAPRIAFALGQSAVSLRQPGGETRLKLGSISGASAASGFEGRLTSADGAIANVPLLIDQASGRWRYRSGVLSLDLPSAHIRDAAEARRFEPVSARDVRLALKDGVIAGSARIVHPQNGTQLALVSLKHDLSATRGNAVLDVPRLVFGDDLQPEALTPLTLGVIANVGGAISGRGDIRWSADGVTSGGTFETDGIGLSAAFGQVHNIKGRIVFDDLLGMTTPPGQIATVGEMNPGVSVKDGVIRYQLLADQHVRVEEGRWPFAGGELILEPTVLDFSRPSDRIFSLTVVGLDAAQFIQQFDFRNFAVTGLFDGRLPLVFNEEGGRIVGGRLVARKQGGTLAYVGEVSDADIGGAGKLAFDALKAMKYNALIIEMDGQLDGEIISSVLFNGSNEQPVNPTGSALPVKATGLPFKFNITVRAPFRALMSTAESFTDVRTTVRQALPADTGNVPGAAPVQPSESEGVR